MALMEIDAGKELWAQGAAFARAQQFAFTWLGLVGLIGIAALLRTKQITTAHRPRMQ